MTMDDTADAPSTEIDPYATLRIPETATAAEIKSAYKQLALRHHPDKVPPSDKAASNRIFQQIVSAYAILSDERRRKRYDATGNTSESLDIDDDDFDWLAFFRTQWSETVTSSTILDYKHNYQGSADEKRDVIAAYVKWEGHMTRIFQQVDLCNMLDDEDRFRRWIDEEIKAGRVEDYDKYQLESDASKQKRRKNAEKEAREAEEHFEKLDRKSKNPGKMGDLASMIQQCQRSRAANFLDDLEAKYAPKNGTLQGGNSKKRKVEEPPEEAFQTMAAKVGKRSRKSAAAPSPKMMDENDEDEIVDLEQASEVSAEEAVQEEAAKGKVTTSGRSKRPSRSRKKGKA